MTYQETLEEYRDVSLQWSVSKDRMRSAGPLLAKWRKEHGVTLRALAGEIGVSFTWLCKVERKREAISAETAERLLSAMKRIEEQKTTARWGYDPQDILAEAGL